jgi:glutamate 5-kinase
MQTYTGIFEKYNLKCAQILLTRDDFHERKRYINAKNTILTLLKLKVIPVINENDTVSVDEIKFGDNDMLSSLVSVLIDADGLEILSNIEGLCRNYDEKKKTYNDLIKKVEKITPEIEVIATGTDNAACVGGMRSKIEAIKIATNVGIPVVLANGNNPALKIDFVNPEQSDGTFFASSSNIKTSKKHWIAFGAKAQGKIIVDDGAKKALLNKNASLLSQGIIKTSGDFSEKDIVEIADKDGNIFAKGISSYSSNKLNEVKGKKAEKEVVHRDNLVPLG